MQQTVGVLVTRRCQSACRHCFVEKKNIELDSKKFSLIRDFCRDIKAKNVKLLGGEPFIFPNLKILIQNFPDHNISITTNGLYIPDWLLDKNIRKCIDKITVSLNYFDDNKYSCFTSLPHGSVDSVKNNIIILSKRYNVWINTCIMPDNQSDIDSIINFAKKSGVKAIKISHLALVGSAKDNYTNNFSEFYNNIYYEEIDNHKCLLGSRYVIDSNLDAYGCITHVNNSSLKLGTLGRNSSVSIVDNSREFQKKYNKMCPLGNARL